MIRVVSFQLLAFVAIFLLISWFKEIDLVDSSGNTSAPPFKLQGVNGINYDESILIGKPTLIYFWAPWCTVCKVSMPNLQEYYESNSDNVNVIAVALSYTTKKEIQEFQANNQFTFPVLLGDAQTAQAYKIKGFPTYYLVNEEGKVVSKSLGYSTELGMMFRTLYNL